MGHLLVYTIGDVVTRFRARNGMHVLHPQGFDSFGLPAENAAIKEGVHPRTSTERNIEGITSSMRRMGWAYDWSRSLTTHDPAYYRWQQWQFLKFLERGLAYRKGAPVKWCPNDQTVLANEQVLADGTCERCGAEVESRLMEQWFFRITDYAQALLDDLDTVDWPESIKARQRNWIGRSEGAEIRFRIEEWNEDVSVFTTRPDTLYGATFFVLAPEHELVARVDSDEVRDYVRRAGAKKTAERAQAAEKTGVFTGLHAVNPVNGERLPVYVADYVLTDYGTGAIMAVPAHDQRDFDFARAFALPIRQVVRPAGAEVDESVAYVEHAEGEVLVNSAEFDDLPAPEGGKRIVEKLEVEGRGSPTINYRLRDWGFSRQRYWGCPIPVVYCDGCGIVPVPEDELPVVLPEIEDYKPKGVPPLAQAEDWVNVPCPRCGGARQARDRDDGHVRRFVLVLPALLRRRQRHGTVRSRGRRLLEPGRPLHRRRRPRDRAHDLCALLDEGAERPRDARLPRAVRAILLERLGHGGEDQDVEAGGEHRRARRVRRTLRRRCLPPEHPLPGAGERGHGVDGVECRGDVALRPAAVAGRRRGCGDRAAERSHERPAGSEDPLGDREGHRRHRTPLCVQHGDRSRDGARERAVPRARRAGLALCRRDRSFARSSRMRRTSRRSCGPASATSGCGRRRGRSPIPRCSRWTPSRSSCR